MSSDNANRLIANPLPIVMVMLLAAGVLVKTVPLESARPRDPERAKFVPSAKQDVEARLWQDPFAAVEMHEKHSGQTQDPHTSEEPLKKSIQEHHQYHSNVTIIAVNVFGGSYTEAAEWRRRSRFAVVSALNFHNYHPENADAIGYFKTDLVDDHHLIVPYEWFKRRGESLGPNVQGGNVLVLWLNEDKLTTQPLVKLSTLIAKLAPHTRDTSSDGLNVKLIGPAGTAMLVELVHDIQGNQDFSRVPPDHRTDPNSPIELKLQGGSTLQVFAASATVSNCDLLASSKKQGGLQSWKCFEHRSDNLRKLKSLPIVRTTGTDDELALALQWELWQRGVNREPSWLTQKETQPVQEESDAPSKCKDGLVLISEGDSEYARTLSRNLTDGFSARCGAQADKVRTFTYLRGLDGVLPNLENSDNKAPSRDNGDKSKDLLAQLKDVPPEHAEGRGQFDYLRRLADEIARLDRDPEFARNGIKAIGIVGSDVYDKLLILQALRSRFKDKIFFTTDLDARYLHSDQKDWARNLVIASNFGLSLRPALQQSTLPFRDSYQTATYLATLIALEDKSHWSNIMKGLLRSHIFEIGRTEAAHPASTSVEHLTTLGLSLHPALQQLTLPFPDSYQTAAHFAKLMMLEDKSLKDWSGVMEGWLRPQLFEIGRTEAVHLASPSVEDLTKWKASSYSEGSARTAEDTKCDGHWVECENIEPSRPSLHLSNENLWIISFIFLGIIFIALLNNRSREMVWAVKDALNSTDHMVAQAAKFEVICAATLVFATLAAVIVVNVAMIKSLKDGVGEPFVWLEGVSVWPNLLISFIGIVTLLALVLAFRIWIRLKAQSISAYLGGALPRTRKFTRSRWATVKTGPEDINIPIFEGDGTADPERLGEAVEIPILWQNYLHVTSWREMAGWILTCTLLVCVLGIIVSHILGWPLIPPLPHRGLLVEQIHFTLIILNVLIFWPVIFWAGYEARACAKFIEIVSSGTCSMWPKRLLDDKQIETGVPPVHIVNYLNFQLVVLVTQRIHGLIYLPFVSILFIVVAQSNFFDTMMVFPLALMFGTGGSLAYALYTTELLRKSAKAARTKALEYYEAQLLIQARPKDSQPAEGNGLLSQPPLSVEQIRLLTERIRNTHEGAFVDLTHQPVLQALLLPFGGYGGMQLVEFLLKP